MKKLFLSMLIVSSLIFTQTYAQLSNEQNAQIGKQAILEKTYIRDNFDNGAKMNQQIADFFTKLRANKDTKTLENLKTRLSPLLKQLSAKPTRSLQEEKIYHLASYLFYRATLELGQ